MAGEVVAIMPEVAAVEQEPNSVEAVGLVDNGPNVDVDPKMPALLKLEKVEVSPATEEVGARELGARTLIQFEVPTVPTEPIMPNVLGITAPPAVDAGPAKPPGLSSRAPRGMPVGPTGLGSGPNVERGEVAPNVGVVVGMTCARLGTLGSADIIMVSNRPAILRALGIGFHRGFRSVEELPDL